MIVFIWSIWQSLSLSHQIMAVTSGCLFIAMIILFIWARTRKILYVIPNLLYKRHSIIQKHATSIDLVSELSEEDLFNAYKIIDIDFANLISSNNLNGFRNEMDVIYAQHKDRVLPDDDTDKFSDYLIKKTGLRKRLEKDVEYAKVEKLIAKMRLLIPTEDMNLVVNKFTKTSNSANSLLPLIQLSNRIPNDTITKMLSVELEAVLIGVNEKMNDEIIASLAKVRESIDKYYRGGH